MLAPVGWRTPPRRYGPWEQVVSVLTEGLVRAGVDVTLFATQDSITRATLRGVCPRGYEEDTTLNRDVWRGLHISEVFEHAGEFDIIHNNFDFLPLTYSQLTATPILTTIHGFSSEKILPVYEKYDQKSYYVSISDANRNPKLHYVATVYHGLDLAQFTFRDNPDDYLLSFGRIDHEKGVDCAIDVARRSGHKLIIAGPIDDQKYFSEYIEPHLDGTTVEYVGNVGPSERDPLLGGAKGLLHMINFDEPFGLAVAEAMACGTPVVAMKRGSMPELLVDGKTGFLVQSADEALSSVQRLSEIDRSVCRRHVEEHFTVDRMVQRYIEVYQKILD